MPSLSLENQIAFIFLPHASSVWAVCLQHGPNDPPSAQCMAMQLHTVWPLLQTWWLVSLSTCMDGRGDSWAGEASAIVLACGLDCSVMEGLTRPLFSLPLLPLLLFLSLSYLFRNQAGWFSLRRRPRNGKCGGVSISICTYMYVCVCEREISCRIPSRLPCVLSAGCVLTLRSTPFFGFLQLCCRGIWLPFVILYTVQVYVHIR